MSLYIFRMCVTEEQSYDYTVEAESKEEAEEKALSGDTTEEELLGYIGITNREILEDMESIG